MRPSEFEEASEPAREVIRDEIKETDGKLPRWVSWTAISTLIMALFSAIGALLAGISANEALLDRTEEIIEVVNRDRDQLRVTILHSKHEVLQALDRQPDPDEIAFVQRKRGSSVDLTKEVGGHDVEISATMFAHELFAVGVTVLSIAITLSGLAVVARLVRIWHAALLLGTAGAGIVVFAVFRMFSA